MATLGDIDPQEIERESVSGNYYTHRLHKRQPYYNKNVILPGELITFTLPNLDTYTLMAQNTWCMTYDLELTGKKDDKQFVVWNLEKSIVDVLRVKIKNETILEIDDYRTLQNYLTIHKTENELKRSIFEGVQLERDLKARLGAETANTGQEEIKRVYGKRFKLNFNMLPLFNSFGPIYPKALKEITIEIRFAPVDKVVRGSSTTKIAAADKDYDYRLTNLKVEWDEFKHPLFAQKMTDKYLTTPLKYKKISRIPLETMKKSDKLKHVRFNTRGASISGFLVIMVDEGKRSAYNHETNQFYNPKSTKFEISYKESSYRVFENGLLPRDAFDSILKLVPETDLKEVDFYTQGFALWVDTRLSTNNSLHETGFKFNDGDAVNIAIHRADETGDATITIYTYIFEDATIELMKPVMIQ